MFILYIPTIGLTSFARISKRNNILRNIFWLPNLSSAWLKFGQKYWLLSRMKDFNWAPNKPRFVQIYSYLWNEMYIFLLSFNFIHETMIWMRIWDWAWPSPYLSIICGVNNAWYLTLLSLWITFTPQIV